MFACSLCYKTPSQPGCDFLGGLTRTRQRKICTIITAIPDGSLLSLPGLVFQARKPRSSGWEAFFLATYKFTYSLCKAAAVGVPHNSPAAGTNLSGKGVWLNSRDSRKRRTRRANGRGRELGRGCLLLLLALSDKKHVETERVALEVHGALMVYTQNFKTLAVPSRISILAYTANEHL